MSNANRLAKNNADRKLKQWFFEQGITYCEWPRGCSDRLGLAPAHDRKQRFITVKNIEDYWLAALLCGKHHHFVEYGDRRHKGTHRRMMRLITVIRNARGTIWDRGRRR